jgi:membrane protease YdiL (CAAX protease family)
MSRTAFFNRFNTRLASTPARLIGAAVAVVVTSILPLPLLNRVAHLLPLWAEPRLLTFATQALVLAAIFAALKIPPGTLSPAPVSRRALTAGAWFVLGTLAFSLLVTVTMFPRSSEAGNLAALVSKWTREFPVTGLAGRLMLVGFLVPIFEEFLYRGLILGRLMRGVPAWLALAVTTTLFAAGHDSWLLSGVTGLALGLLYLRYRSVWVCVLVHGAHNLVSSAGATLLVAYLRDLQALKWVEGPLLPLQLAWLAFVVACLARFVAEVFARIDGESRLLLRQRVGARVSLRPGVSSFQLSK